ncbi:MAG: hypothetical protein RMI91_13360 [Gemmatales bacterium]|nr:hypothetical protein [Gemmatales bacterium]MDW7995633.1 hypothetical protein [Gemmatales bacterium]
MLEIFVLRLVIGMLGALVVLPRKEVPPRFFRIHLLIALGLLCLTGIAAVPRDAATFWVGLGLAGAACFAGTWFWMAEPDALGLVPIMLAILASAGSLSVCLASKAPQPWLILDNATAAAQLGFALTAMLLGHYYLIAPGMSVRPLVRLTWLLIVSIVARAVVSLAHYGFVCVSNGGVLASLDRGLWFALRGLAGIVAALIFGYLAYRCARLRSTQSATGILYAATIASFLGELAQLLLEHTT